MRSIRHTAAGVALLVCVLFLLQAAAFGQAQPPKEGQEKYWKVPGYRHGPSFFPNNYLVETTPLREGVFDFKHYHTNDEMVFWMKKWAKEYPDLLDVYVAAKGFGGTDIYQATLTNKKTGKDTDKPAMFIDANRHSGEVTAAESAFWMLHHMLTNYGRDPEITKMIDNSAFYFRPKNNPDGSMLYLVTAQTLRSTIRPYDSDRDGLLDEDPAEDLDGDGFIRQMRVKVPMGEGDYIVHPDDPRGLLMQRVGRGEGDYNVMSEGIDNDGDGRVNEDGIGGLDLHRNYPENWRPMSEVEATGRGYTQGGAGAFPLSEVETRSLVLFLLEHPNISAMNTMDTTVPMHLRPPSTSPSEERMYPEDLDLYRYFDEEGKKITGYARAGDVYMDYGRGRPLFGHSPDFGYWYYGAIWYGDELWNGGRVGDEDGDGDENTDFDKLIWQENNLDKIRYQKWAPAKHPEYGDVEVGGWNPKFWRQNPPPEILEEWASKQARFNLLIAKSLPHVVMGEPKISGKNGEYTVEVELENTGFIPTALRQAQLVKIVRNDMVSLEFPRGYVRMAGGAGRGRGGMQQEEQQEAARVEFLEPEGAARGVDIDRLAGGEKKKIKFKVKFNDITSATATLRYVSTRGGIIEKEITIGGN